MKGVLYLGIVKPAAESPDGETASYYAVTEEANGYAIWWSSFECATTCVRHEPFWDRSAAIELCVELVQAARKAEEPK